MQNVLKLFGVKDIDSFDKRFRYSLWKLTALYSMILLIILLISSSVIYTAFSSRLERRYREFRIIPTAQPGVAVLAPPPTQPTREEVEKELTDALILVNGVLLVVASVASYGLALITLQPLRESYETQRRFLADASHELRTPLSILKINLENDISNASMPAAQKAKIQSHLEEVDRMSTLVGDLLTLSRLGDQQQVEHEVTVTIHLNELIKKVHDRLSPLAKKHHTTLDISKSLEDIMIVSDREQIMTALTNVVKNAILYNGKQGTVDISLSSDDLWAYVQVHDNGVGIAQKELPKIFERFYRTDKSRSRKTGGNGLGLSIVQASMQHIGGSVSIESAPDQGTTVTLNIPLA